MDKPIGNSVKINGDLFVGDDNGDSHNIYLRFRGDTTNANSSAILAVPNDGASYEDRQAAIGFLRGPNNGEVCAYMGTGDSPFNTGFKVFEDRIQYCGAAFHYIKNSYRSGVTCYQQDDTGLIWQCGRATVNAGAGGDASGTVTLPRPMKDTSYLVFASCAGQIGASLFVSGTAKSTTQVIIKLYNYPANYDAGVNWLVVGMGA